MPRFWQSNVPERFTICFVVPKQVAEGIDPFNKVNKEITTNERTTSNVTTIGPTPRTRPNGRPQELSFHARLLVYGRPDYFRQRFPAGNINNTCCNHFDEQQPPIPTLRPCY